MLLPPSDVIRRIEFPIRHAKIFDIVNSNHYSTLLLAQAARTLRADQLVKRFRMLRHRRFGETLLVFFAGSISAESHFSRFFGTGLEDVETARQGNRVHKA